MCWIPLATMHKTAMQNTDEFENPSSASNNVIVMIKISSFAFLLSFIFQFGIPLSSTMPRARRAKVLSIIRSSGVATPRMRPRKVKKIITMVSHASEPNFPFHTVNPNANNIPKKINVTIFILSSFFFLSFFIFGVVVLMVVGSGGDAGKRKSKEKEKEDTRTGMFFLKVDLAFSIVKVVSIHFCPFVIYPWIISKR